MRQSEDEKLREAAINKLSEDEWAAISNSEYKSGMFAGRNQALGEVRKILSDKASAAFMNGNDEYAKAIRELMKAIPAN